MRDYGKVFSSFWTSEDIRSMSEDARQLALYLLTCPHATIAGVFRLTDGYACDDLQWGSERVTQGFAELFAKGFAYRCETTKWVWVRKHLTWNPPENPNQRKAAVKIALSVPDKCAWKADFMRVSADILGAPELAEWNPSPTVSQPFRNQEQEQEQKQEQKSVTPAPDDPHAEQSPLASGKPAAPPKAPSQEKSTADSAKQAVYRSTWSAYCEAYQQRYAVPPVRNAKVNALVKQFVERVGADDAPHVAAFYVGHAAAYYARKGHDWGSLVSDAEKLRTEWVTGRMVTATSAQQEDRTRSNFEAANEAVKILEAQGVGT